MALEIAKTKYETRKKAFEDSCSEAAKGLEEDTPNIKTLKGVYTRIKRSYERVLSANDNYMDLLFKATPLPKDDLQQAEDEQMAIVQQADIALLELEELFGKDKLPMEAADDDAGSSASQRGAHIHRLPKLELPKFGGEARDWLQFWSAFQTIDDDDTMAATMKFQYLKNCMIPGSAAQELVSSYPVTANNYPKVIQSLNERFGREDMLVEVYVRDLIALILENAQNKSITSFSSLFVRLSSQLRALGSLGVTTDKCAAILYPMVESALPEDIFVAWERNRQHTTVVAYGAKQTSEGHLEKLMEFLKYEVEGSERIRLARQPFSTHQASKQVNPDKYKHRTNVPTAANFVTTEVKPSSGCLFCGGKHSSDKCCKAVSMSLEERRKLVQESRRCYACLKGGHSAKKCRGAIRCVLCGRKHYAILCPEIGAAAEKKNADNKEKNDDQDKKPERSSSFGLCNQMTSQEVILQTVVVKVIGKKKTKTLRVLFDNGSQTSYILQKTAKELELEQVGEKEVIHILFGGTRTEPRKHTCYKIQVSDLTSSFSCNMTIQDSASICGKIANLPRGNWQGELKQKGIKLYDNQHGGSSEIEMLIGSDVYAKLLTGRKLELSSGPVALETKLGWTISGKFKGSEEVDKGDSTMAVMSYHVRDATIQDLWNLDVIGIHDPMKEKNKQELAEAAMRHFKQTVTRREDGRYVVNLPWIEGHQSIPSYRFIAEKKLQSTTANLKKKEVLNAYHEVFSSWEQEGVIERVPQGPGHYLSHHGVLKPDSQTTPVRPVFNASFKTKENSSLNDCLEIGPNLLEEIPNIVTGFRTGPVGVTSDIRKAFLQIEIAEADRDFVRCLWYKDESFSPIQDFRHCRVVFGVSSSPFLLAAVLDHHLNNCEEKLQSTATILRKGFYVDNCVVSLSSLEEALKFKEEATQLLASCQMDLRCWEIGPSFEEKQVPVLGLTWNLKTDLLACDLRGTLKKIDDGPTTRRKILSVAHSLFDPVGVTCAFTIIPKMLLQSSYKLKAGWDTELPEDIDKKFKAWCHQLEDVYQKIKREARGRYTFLMMLPVLPMHLVRI